MHGRRSFLALLAAALAASLSRATPGQAGAGGGNTLGQMTKQGGQFHATTMKAARQAKEEIEAKKAKQEKDAQREGQESVD